MLAEIASVAKPATALVPQRLGDPLRYYYRAASRVDTFECRPNRPGVSYRRGIDIGWQPIESSLRPDPVIDPPQADVELDVLFAPYGPCPSSVSTRASMIFARIVLLYLLHSYGPCGILSAMR